MVLNRQLLTIQPVGDEQVCIYTVNRNYVILHYYADFTMGGHWYVGETYHFIPRGEIWLDQDMDEVGQAATAIHELVEYELMKYGGADYDAAHACASLKERQFLASQAGDVVKAALYEDQLRDINYDRSEPDMERGGGEGGTLNDLEMVKQVMAPSAAAERRRQLEGGQYE